MDFRQSSYFIALVEEGSFTKAARRLHATQPGISVLVAELEKRFGVQLVERRPRGISVTAAGERLYECCLDIMRAVESARVQMNEIKNATMGTVSIGLPPTLCRGISTRVLSGFDRAYPFVELRLVEALSRELTDRVSAHELDFAVVTKAEKIRGLKHAFLHRDHLVLISGSAAGFQNMQPVSLSDLPPLKLILPSRNQFLGETIYQTLHSRGVRVQKTLEVDGLISLIDMVKNTDWVSFLPTIAINPTRDSRAFTITPIVEGFVDFEYFLVESSSAALSEPARNLVRLVEDAFSTASRKWPSSIRSSEFGFR